MRIAIFGGSFEPLHTGHTEVVKQALEVLEIDKLFIVPTFLNPFKTKTYVDIKTKTHWLKRVFQEHKKVEVLEYEIEQKKAVNSIETVEFIEQKYNPSKIYFIIGADNLNSLHKWYKYEKLNKKVEFVVATRDDIPIDTKFKRLLVKMSISSSKLREELDLSFISDEIKNEVKEYYEK